MNLIWERAKGMPLCCNVDSEGRKNYRTIWWNPLKHSHWVISLHILEGFRVEHISSCEAMSSLRAHCNSCSQKHQGCRAQLGQLAERWLWWWSPHYPPTGLVTGSSPPKEGPARLAAGEPCTASHCQLNCCKQLRETKGDPSAADTEEAAPWEPLERHSDQTGETLQPLVQLCLV